MCQFEAYVVCSEQMNTSTSQTRFIEANAVISCSRVRVQKRILSRLVRFVAFCGSIQFCVCLCFQMLDCVTYFKEYVKKSSGAG